MSLHAQPLSAVSNQVRSAVLPLLHEHKIPSCRLTWHLVALVRRNAPIDEIAETQIDLERLILGHPNDLRKIPAKRRERVEDFIECFTEEVRDLSLLR